MAGGMCYWYLLLYRYRFGSRHLFGVRFGILVFLHLPMTGARRALHGEGMDRLPCFHACRLATAMITSEMGSEKRKVYCGGSWRTGFGVWRWAGGL